MSSYSDAFLIFLKGITAKRPRTVIDHILKHGFITTQEIKDLYGYNHPPRAIRDVRECGVPVETYRIRGSDGRSIAAYRFGDPNTLQNNLAKTAGRTLLSKALKQALIEKYGAKCFIYLEPMEVELLQVDHRVPYEIGGELGRDNIDRYMLLSPSANRAKSWTCEHCPNWVKRSYEFCINCFWSSPEKYDHIAGKPERVISVVFTGNEIEDYNKLIELSGIEKAQVIIKRIIHDHIK